MLHHIVRLDTAVLIAQVMMVLSWIIMGMRSLLNAELCHRFLNFFTHYLEDSKSETAHKLYRKIHRRLPPFDNHAHLH